VLGASQNILPVGARKLLGREVGLLERFDIGDVKVGVLGGLASEDVD
jgi:hypothetical protein